MTEKQVIRCSWCGNDELYTKYHDEEWGKPVQNDQTLFEFLILESAQAGLSWITILRRRENYRRAFANFDPVKVASFTETDVERLLQNEGIIRNKLKIKAAISNAILFLQVQKQYGSFYQYLYGFLPEGKPLINLKRLENGAIITSGISDAISKDLKKRGFKFFGPVICYAYMQAVGMVNDHVSECSFRF
ncbi:DNA-3-methyladenine glycosylase I [Mucilaginibacter sp.]|uniref:DNA-3-methyladenine glycosylase I n=1 Tax=Mucilaginibacter sp. TaxID=1882438 RepID=UPI003B008A89